MTFYVGHKGAVKLKRSTQASGGFITQELVPDDIVLTLNRFTLDTASGNLFNGDRVEITTSDPRGLAFLRGANTDSFIAYVNVNAIGGIRLFSTFEDAINNNRINEVLLQSFTGGPLPLQLELRDTTYNILGDVSSYNFTTDIDTIDVTSLSDTYKSQFSAGLVSGSGTFDCLFNYKTVGFREPSFLMLHLAQRLELKSEFGLYLFLTDKAIDPSVETVFYELNASISRAGVQVSADSLISCTIDFISTGEISLRYGRPSEYILKEDEDRIQLEQSLDFLLQEITD